MSKYLLLGYLAVSAIAFVMFWYDWKLKSKKQYDKRFPERDLILVTLIGGSMGALLGMVTFHHKTNRKRFVIGVPLILLIHLALLVAVKWKMG